MFHGNAGNIGHRIPIARVLEENSGCGILMLEYRGYGLSSGTPNEEGLIIDAQAGLDYIRQNKRTQGGKIIVYGQSLGGAVGIQLVAKNQEAGDIAGLILENTFTSMKKLIPRCVKTVGDGGAVAYVLLVCSHRLNILLSSAINPGWVKTFFLELPTFLFSS